LRVPALRTSLAALRAITAPVMQSSANLSGGGEARRLEEVPSSLRAGADLVLDGGELPGTASTVVDLRGYAHARRWQVLREGALAAEAVDQMLAQL
jgi:L-threonylcarbamoyladenylate synthase